MRYWGPVPELGEGDWVGVELENPVGDTDGSYAGTVYFVAQPNHAIFVSPSIISVRLARLCVCWVGWGGDSRPSLSSDPPIPSTTNSRTTSP